MLARVDLRAAAGAVLEAAFLPLSSAAGLHLPRCLAIAPSGSFAIIGDHQAHSLAPAPTHELPIWFLDLQTYELRPLLGSCRLRTPGHVDISACGEYAVFCEQPHPCPHSKRRLVTIRMPNQLEQLVVRGATVAVNLAVERTPSLAPHVLLGALRFASSEYALELLDMWHEPVREGLPELESALLNAPELWATWCVRADAHSAAVVDRLVEWSPALLGTAALAHALTRRALTESAGAGAAVVLRLLDAGAVLDAVVCEGLLAAGRPPLADEPPLGSVWSRLVIGDVWVCNRRPEPRPFARADDADSERLPSLCGQHFNPSYPAREHSSVQWEERSGMGHASSRLYDFCWAPRGGGDEHWLQFDMGGTVHMYGVAVQPRNNGPPSMRVTDLRAFTSLDGKLWSAVAGPSGAFPWGEVPNGQPFQTGSQHHEDAVRRVRFPQPVSGRYLRVQPLGQKGLRIGVLLKQDRAAELVAALITRAPASLLLPAMRHALVEAASGETVYPLVQLGAAHEEVRALLASEEAAALLLEGGGRGWGTLALSDDKSAQLAVERLIELHPSMYDKAIGPGAFLAAARVPTAAKATQLLQHLVSLDEALDDGASVRTKMLEGGAEGQWAALLAAARDGDAACARLCAACRDMCAMVDDDLRALRRARATEPGLHLVFQLRGSAITIDNETVPIDSSTLKKTLWSTATLERPTDQSLIAKVTRTVLVGEYSTPRDVRYMTPDDTTTTQTWLGEQWLSAPEWLDTRGEFECLASAHRYVPGLAHELGTVDLQCRLRPTWLAHVGCAPGTRLAMHMGRGELQVVTCVELGPNDLYTVRVDNSEATLQLDPRPGTALSAPSIRQAVGSRLMLVDGDALVDAHVVEATPQLLAGRSLDGNRHAVRTRLLAAEGSLAKQLGLGILTMPGTVSSRAKRLWIAAKDALVHVQRQSKLLLVDLNSYNHCTQHLADVREYHEALTAHCLAVMATNEFVEDAITGKRLNVETQTIALDIDSGARGQTDLTGVSVDDLQYIPASWEHPLEKGQRVRAQERHGVVTDASQAPRQYTINFDGGGEPEKLSVYALEQGVPPLGVQSDEWLEAKNMVTIAGLLAKRAPLRSQGRFESQPLLLRAGPGTGKSWSMMQLVFLLAKLAISSRSEAVRFVPLLVPVQKLVRYFDPSQPDANLVLAFIRSEFHSPVREMLLQAYGLNAMILLLDGIDEAAGLKEAIEDLVLNELVTTGMRVCVTSRPEGVRLKLYAARFVVLNLRPLSISQQQKAIAQQVAGDELVERLYAICEVRAGHDTLYRESVALAEQHTIEGLQKVDRFFTPARQYDASLNQRSLDGSRFVEVRPRDAQRSRAVLGATAAFERFHMLALVEEWLKSTNGSMSSAAELKKELERSIKGDVAAKEAQAAGYATRLALLTFARRQGSAATLSPTALWEEIASRTDEVLEVGEVLLPKAELCLSQLCRALQLRKEALSFGSLKDPVRLYEKAVNDYSDRAWPPEAAVFDVLRCRIVVNDTSKFVPLLQKLAAGGGGADGKLVEVFATTIDGEPARLESVRIKNFFDPATPDPTRFRRFVFNARLSVGRASMHVEIQCHHQKILDYNNVSHSHEHYEFFRTKLASSYEKGLNSMLDNAFRFFDELKGVPVLLSMLIVILIAREDDAKLHLPSNRRELYQTATSTVLKLYCIDEHGSFDAEALPVLRVIATANMLPSAQRRLFTSSDVVRALRKAEGGGGSGDIQDGDARDGAAEGGADNGALFECWRRLRALTTEQGVAGIPTVKTLSEGGESAEGEYQFKHLSIQEALFVEALERGEAGGFEAADEEQAAKRLADPFYRNTFNLGGVTCGEALIRSWPRRPEDGAVCLDFYDTPLTASAYENACRCFRLGEDAKADGGTPTTPKELIGLRIEENASANMVGFTHPLEHFAHFRGLRCLDVRSTGVRGELSVVGALTSLQSLNLSATKVTGSLDALEPLHELEELHLDRTAVTGSLLPLGRGCPKLHSLHISRMPGLRVDLDREVAQLPNLRKLYMIASGGIKGSLAFAAHLPQLEELDCSELLDLTGDLESLAGARNLAFLSVGGCRELFRNTARTDEGLAPLASLTKLSSLHLGSTDVCSTLKPLAGLTELTLLGIGNARALHGGLEPLAGLPKLARVFMDECTGLTGDVGVMGKLPSLKELSIGACIGLTGVATFQAEHRERVNFSCFGLL